MNFVDTGSGPPLLFLHGVGMCAAAYRPLFNLLSKHFRILAPDLPGVGRSPLPEETSLDAFATEIQGFLDERRVRPEAVVGHSLGGGVALSLARKQGFPRSLVLIDTVGAGSPCSTPSLLARFLLLKNLRVLASPSRWPALWRVLPHFMGSMGLRLGKILRLGTLAIRSAQESHAALAAPGPKPVFVSAVDDELFPPALYRACAARLPGARVIEVKGGHDWCLLHPEPAAEVLMSVLAGPEA